MLACDYTPLIPPLATVLGGTVLAVFTVWLNNKNNRRREREQISREKLEALIGSIETVGRGIGSWGHARLTLPGRLNSGSLDFFDSIKPKIEDLILKAAPTAIYFPHMADDVADVAIGLSSVARYLIREAGTDDWEQKSKDEALRARVFGEFDRLMREVVGPPRARIIQEARRMHLKGFP